MKEICAWCKKVMRDGDDTVITHGICEGCMDRVLHEENTTSDSTIADCAPVSGVDARD